jgi:hypothetical protein
MKKTLIAAGIAAVVAAPAAFADVKVSGVIEQAITMIENGNTTSSQDNSVTFAASEDLGNGLSAFASGTISMNTSAGTKDQKLGLKGSFGTLVVGRMETVGRSTIASQMTFVGASGAGGDSAGATAGTASVEGAIFSGTGRTDGGVAYVSPTMNGFHFTVAGFADNATEVTGHYDNGPLSLKASYEEVKSIGDSTDTLMLSAAYTMGDAKFTVLRSNQEAANASVDGTDMAYRLDYKMGNNTLSLGFADSETNAGVDDGDVTAVELVHNFSKRTAVYGSYVMDDNAGSTADVDTFTVGMLHKF